MTVKTVRAENLLVSLLWLVMAGGAVSSCAWTGIRAIAPSNGPPEFSGRWRAGDNLPHSGISIDGRGNVNHEIVAPSEGVVVLVRGNRVRIHHGPDAMKHDIYTEHFHLHGGLLKEGDQVKRGQTIGTIARGKYSTHYHYVVTKRAARGGLIVLDPFDYWFGIDQYKEKLAKGLNIGPFVIACFDPNVNYPKEPIRFTYPGKCW
jgi:hypothetical protein